MFVYSSAIMELYVPVHVQTLSLRTQGFRIPMHIVEGDWLRILA